MDRITLLENTKIKALDDPSYMKFDENGGKYYEYTSAALKQKFLRRESVADIMEAELNERLRSAQEIIEDARAEGVTDAEREEYRARFQQEREHFDTERHQYSQERREVRFAQSWLEQDAFAPAFAQLYRIKDLSEKYGENAKVKFEVIEDSKDSGYLTYEQYLAKNVSWLAQNEEDRGKIPHLSLNIELESGLNFNLMAEPYNGNEARSKLQIALDKETLEQFDFSDKSQDKVNKEKIKQIVEYCEKFGFSVFDLSIPTTYEGDVDIDAFYKAHELDIPSGELLDLQRGFYRVLREIQNEKEAEYRQRDEDEMRSMEVTRARKAAEKENDPDFNPDDYGDDLEPKESASAGEEELPDPEWVEAARDSTDEVQQAAAQAYMAAKAAKKKERKKKALKSVEKEIEDLLQSGFGKQRDVSYIKKGLFHSAWTEYIVYDQDYAYKDDGKRDKNGVAKFTYSYKLFIRKDKNGGISFAYRTPNGKKIDDSVIDGLAGKFKDLGYTHINFPQGIPDNEKAIWRKALAEKGIVIKGMSIDRSKAEGMIKAAKEKLSTEKLVEFKYRLALQMKENYAAKGKTPDDSEREFVQGLINSYRYRAFTNGYAMAVKSKLTHIMRDDTDRDFGAVNKIAAFRTLRVMFDLYQAALDSPSLLVDGIKTKEGFELNDKEKEDLRQAGLVGPVEEFTPEQLATLYEILGHRQREEVKTVVYADLDEMMDQPEYFRGAKRAHDIIIRGIYDTEVQKVNGINEDLAANGIDEIGLPKSTRARLDYNDYRRYRIELEARRPKTDDKSRGGSTGPVISPTEYGGYSHE